MSTTVSLIWRVAGSYALFCLGWLLTVLLCQRSLPLPKKARNRTNRSVDRSPGSCPLEWPGVAHSLQVLCDVQPRITLGGQWRVLLRLSRSALPFR